MTAPLPHMKLVDAGVPSTQLVQVRRSINVARQRVASADNAEFTQLYWHIGHRISAELLQGQRGQYGKHTAIWKKPETLRRCMQRTLTPTRRGRPLAPVFHPLSPGEGRGEGQHSTAPHVEPHNTSAWAQYTVQVSNRPRCKTRCNSKASPPPCTTSYHLIDNQQSPILKFH